MTKQRKFMPDNVSLRMAQIVKVLQEGSYTAREISNITKIPIRSVYRLLKPLENRDLVINDKGKYYWYRNIKTYETIYDYELDLNHSRKLVPAFKEVLNDLRRHAFKLYRVDEDPLDQIVKHNSAIRQQLESILENHTGMYDYAQKNHYPEMRLTQTYEKILKGRQLRPYAEMHIKTGYPDIWKMIVKFRASHEKEERLKIFREIAGDIYRIIMEIDMGRPMNGKCEMCPRIHIAESRREEGKKLRE